MIERLVQNAAHELDMDPAELRLKNFIQPDQFPYESPTGFIYDSGDYERALKLAMDMIGYDDLRAEQAEGPKDGKLLGIGMQISAECDDSAADVDDVLDHVREVHPRQPQ